MGASVAFGKRNIKELSRDPLSYIFCVGFPLVMLIVMTLVDKSIPAQANMTVFHIESLSGGIAVFGQTFIMLFTALTVSQDRSGSFLVRMYATPMRSLDFVMGYIFPMLIISAAQIVMTFAASLIIALIEGVSLNIGGLLLSAVTLLPSALMFIGFGLLFGTLFNPKAAPGLCSIIISLGSFLGCIFFDAEGTGGVLLKVCKALPFYYCTKSARSAIALDITAKGYAIPLVVVTLCAAVLIALSAAVFNSRMKADLA